MKTLKLASKSIFGNDTRPDLERKGFTILREHPGEYYVVKPPEGWRMEPLDNINAEIFDSESNLQIVQHMRSPDLEGTGESEAYLTINQD